MQHDRENVAYPDLSYSGSQAGNDVPVTSQLQARGATPTEVQLLLMEDVLKQYPGHRGKFDLSNLRFSQGCRLSGEECRFRGCTLRKVRFGGIVIGGRLLD